MVTVSKRELNHRMAAVLDMVSETEDVIVTERGAAKWRISAAHESESVLTKWEREGRYVPPSTEPAPWPEAAGGPHYSSSDIDELLEQMRGEH